MICVMKLTTNPMSTAAAALVTTATLAWWGLRYNRSVTQPKPSAPTTQNSSEWLMPRWKARLSSSLRKYLPRTSMSGMVPATAPQTMARLPMRRPSTTSPTAAPNTICDSESIKQRSVAQRLTETQQRQNARMGKHGLPRNFPFPTAAPSCRPRTSSHA